MLTCLVDTTLQSTHEDEALEKLRRLESVPDLPVAYLERLREGAATSAVFGHGPALDALNQILVTRRLQKVAGDEANALALNDDIPF
jgi:hypothetical protein